MSIQRADPTPSDEKDRLAREQDRHELAHVASRGMVFKFGSLFASKVFGLVFQILVLNVLPSLAAGLYSAAYNIALGISAFASLGIQSALMRYVPMHIARGEPPKAKEEIWTSAVILFAFSLLVLAAMLLLSETVISFYAPEYHDQIRPLFLLAAVLAFAMLNFNLWSAILDSLKKFELNALIQVVVQAVKVALVVAAVLLGVASAGVFLQATVAAFVVATLILTIPIWQYLCSIPGKLRFNPSLILKNIAFGLPIYLSSTADVLTTAMSAPILLYFYPLQVAGYAAAVMIVQNIAPVVFSPIGSVAQPLMVERHERKSDMFGSLVRESSRWTAYLGIPLLFVFVLYASAFLGVLTPAYKSSYILIWLFAPMSIASLLSSPSRNALFARGNLKVLLGASLSMLALNLVLSWYFIQQWGAVGAAMATSISVFLGESAIVLAARFTFGAKLHPDIWRALGAGFVMLAVGFAPLPVLNASLSLWAESGLIPMAIAAIISAVVYGLSVLALGGIRKNDWELGLKLAHRNGLEPLLRRLPFVWPLLVRLSGRQTG
ncbi:MAG: oligosaccharide flippase family protein [Candidatus Micrarchaeota archaeon]